MSKVAYIKKPSKTDDGPLKDNEAKEEHGIPYYLGLLKTSPLDQKAYNRLMILYRRAKEYSKELKIIDRAIKEFRGFYNSHRKVAVKNVQHISKKLNRSLGLTDDKGKEFFQQEPIASWEKRRQVVLKKLE